MSSENECYSNTRKGKILILVLMLALGRFHGEISTLMVAPVLVSVVKTRCKEELQFLLNLSFFGLPFVYS